jgi:hypothetical protein
MTEQVSVHILASRSSLYPEIADMFDAFEGSYDPRLALLLSSSLHKALDENDIYLDKVALTLIGGLEDTNIARKGRRSICCRKYHREGRARAHQHLHLDYSRFGCPASASRTPFQGRARALDPAAGQSFRRLVLWQPGAG